MKRLAAYLIITAIEDLVRYTSAYQAGTVEAQEHALLWFLTDQHDIPCRIIGIDAGMVKLRAMQLFTAWIAHMEHPHIARHPLWYYDKQIGTNGYA